MIQISPQMKILVAVEAVAFRKGIDGLAGTYAVGLCGVNTSSIIKAIAQFELKY